MLQVSKVKGTTHCAAKRAPGKLAAGEPDRRGSGGGKNGRKQGGPGTALPAQLRRRGSGRGDVRGAGGRRKRPGTQGPVQATGRSRERPRRAVAQEAGRRRRGGAGGEAAVQGAHGRLAGA